MPANWPMVRSSVSPVTSPAWKRWRRRLLRWLYLAVAKVAQLGRPGEIVALLHRFPLCAAVVAARRWCDVTHTTILVSFSMSRKPALVRRPHSGLLTNSGLAPLG